MNRFLLPLLMFLPTFLLLIYYLSGGATKLGANEFLVLAVLIVLGTIANFSIRSNNTIFTFLNKQDEDLSKNPENNQLAATIWRAFNDKKERTKTQLNIPSFIEVFMSEYHIDNKTSIVKRMKLIHTFASISILVGVLGTFTGLVITLAALNPSDIDKSILKVLGGVHTAFFTSIGGILFSIAINLHSKVRNSEQLLLQVMLKVENFIHQKDQKTSDYYVVEAIGGVKEAVHNMGNAFLEVAHFSKEFKTATDNLKQFNNNFKQNTMEVSGLFKDMMAITELFNQKTALIHDDFERMFTYFNNQHNLNNEIKMTFENTAHDIKSFVANQNNVIDGFMKNNYNLHNSYKSLVDSSQQEIQQAYKEMANFFEGTTSQISQIVTQNESQVDMHKQLTESIYKQIKKEQAGLLKQLKESNSENGEVKDLFKDAVTSMGNYMSIQESSNQSLETSLNVLSNNIKNTNDLIGKLDQSFSKGAKETPEALNSLESTLNDLMKSLETFSEKMNEKQYAVNLSK
ncbi:MotA/TolQ/ExbB proton channel family protein [Neobacillus sp. BF23-41]|uniref:MotA/TolQ/ExbB proton channel family protein n=1 Tax=Neobacillus sp. BF23-41 TaxID=3240280 RepID=UPI0034E443CB